PMGLGGGSAGWHPPCRCQVAGSNEGRQAMEFKVVIDVETGEAFAGEADRNRFEDLALLLAQCQGKRDMVVSGTIVAAQDHVDAKRVARALTALRRSLARGWEPTKEVA